MARRSGGLLVQQHEARKLEDWSRVNGWMPWRRKIHAARTRDALSAFRENGGCRFSRSAIPSITAVPPSDSQRVLQVFPLAW